MLAGRHLNILALACICATFVAMDGPLLQRASSVRSMIPEQPVSLGVSITPEMPAYFSGWYEYLPRKDGEILSDFDKIFLPVVRAYSSNVPISGGIQGCSGICRTTVHAPALAVDHCEHQITYRNFSETLGRTAEQFLKGRWKLRRLERCLRLKSPQ